MEICRVGWVSLWLSTPWTQVSARPTTSPTCPMSSSTLGAAASVDKHTEDWYRMRIVLLVLELRLYFPLFLPFPSPPSLEVVIQVQSITIQSGHHDIDFIDFTLYTYCCSTTNPFRQNQNSKRQQALTFCKTLSIFKLKLKIRSCLPTLLIFLASSERLQC